MKTILFTLFCSYLFSTTLFGQNAAIILGIHSEYPNAEDFKVEFINAQGAVAFVHTGANYGWGMSATGKSIPTGAYQLVVTWKNEAQQVKKTQQAITIQPNTKAFSLNIELANEPGRTFNGLYLDQYTYANLPGVEFKQNWNPQQQWKKDSLLLPDYTVINHQDSTLYGAYGRASSRLTINWTHPHYIAFARFEQKEGDQWKGLFCNAPRIRMKIPRGAQGTTLKDMVLGCPVQELGAGIEYRVRINYMLDNRLLVENPATTQWEANTYIEQTIYSHIHEFQLK